MIKRLLLYIGLVLFALSGNTNDLHARNLDSTEWSKMSEKYDYPLPANKKKEEKVEEKEPEKKDKKDRKKLNPNPPKFNLGNIMLYIGIAVLFILLIVLLVKTDVIVLGRRNVKLRTEYDAENPDELVLTELEKELEAAALANNYNRCLRYEFLILLERMQDLGLIRWHKYTTNGEYLNQIINYKEYKRIRDLTRVYEYYWYGEHVLSLDNYNKLVVIFNHLKDEMRHEKK